MLQQKMEGMTMVVVAQVAEFVQEDIVPQDMRKADYVQIEIDIVACRATAPIAGVVLDGHLIIYESIVCCQFCKSLRKFGFRLATQGLDLRRRSHRRILETIFLPADNIQHPLTFELEECHSGSIRN